MKVALCILGGLACVGLGALGAYVWAIVYLAKRWPR